MLHVVKQSAVTSWIETSCPDAVLHDSTEKLLSSKTLLIKGRQTPHLLLLLFLAGAFKLYVKHIGVATLLTVFFSFLWKNKKSLVAFKIMPLENMNEFTTHILETVNAHMILRKNLLVCSWGCGSITAVARCYWSSPKEISGFSGKLCVSCGSAKPGV